MTAPSSIPNPARRLRPGRGSSGVVATALALVVVVWLVGLAAIGRSAESLCFDDLENAPAYGAYSQSGQLWPAEFQCTLQPVDPAANPIAVVSHPWFAVLRLAVTVGLPVAAVAGAALALVWLGFR